MSIDPSSITRLQPSAKAPALARRALREVADDLVAASVTETAELLTSELVTNAVVHGRGVVTLAIECSQKTLSVSVTDENPTVPEIVPERPLAVGGRGLRMVELLASQWGVSARRDGPGKVVWFRVH